MGKTKLQYLWMHIRMLKPTHTYKEVVTVKFRIIVKWGRRENSDGDRAFNWASGWLLNSISWPDDGYDRQFMNIYIHFGGVCICILFYN